MDVPTKNTLTNSAKTGGINGIASGLGRNVGRSFLGPGLGTAVGGIAAAAALSGNDRDVVATLAVDHAIDELFAGGGSSSQSAGVM